MPPVDSHRNMQVPFSTLAEAEEQQPHLHVHWPLLHCPGMDSVRGASGQSHAFPVPPLDSGFFPPASCLKISDYYDVPARGRGEAKDALCSCQPWP